MHIPTQEEAEDSRNSGIARSVNHADSVDDKWSDRAYYVLMRYAEMQKGTGRKFLAEDVRQFAAGNGFKTPTSSKAWGAVMQRAAKNKLIVKVGYAPARSSNLSPKCQWVSA